jgi:CHAT domain-containing protein
MQIFRISDAPGIRRQLESVLGGIGRRDPTVLSDLDSLGRRLLGPLARKLPERVYLQSYGPLNGFAFDLLRESGQFLAERHRVTQISSLAGLARRQRTMSQDLGESVFLGGNPQTGQALFSYDVPVSREIQVVTDRFVGPGLHIVQGLAFRKDEFADSRFAGAGLVHLAAPGALDPSHPDRSRLYLSGRTGEDQGDFLAPADLRDFEFAAELVFLSGTTVVGPPETAFDSGLGFVWDFLEGGAQSVVYSAWPAGEAATARFVETFYRRLESGQDPAETLWMTRKSLMDPENPANFLAWAGFQLFIR